MGPMEALKIALEKENASIKLYNKFYLQYPEMKEMLLFLINEEEKHKQLIEKQMVKLRSG
jgi:rubrerythrin